MLEDQNYECKICGKVHNNKLQFHFHIDHCHDTGNVRGLLCNKCNQGIGLLNDDPIVLERALYYLKESLYKKGKE